MKKIYFTLFTPTLHFFYTNYVINLERNLLIMNTLYFTIYSYFTLFTLTIHIYPYFSVFQVFIGESVKSVKCTKMNTK